MKRKILLVDDNRLLLKYMHTLLEREGHEVVTAEDGLAAIDILSQYTPDFMFIDLIMPKIEGTRLCEIVRNMKSMDDCFISLLSAAVPELEVDFRKIGANACIAKGAFHVMAEHVLSVINNSDAVGVEILGIDAIKPRQMTRELLSQNHHMKTVLETMDDGILETFSGRVVSANSAAVQIFNTSRELLLAIYLPDLFEPSTRSIIETLLNDPSLEPPDIGYRQPVKLHGKLVTVRILPVDEKGSHIVLIRDVSQQKKLEAELQKAQKMEALGTLAGGIAHDFNNLLMGIMANASNMLRLIDSQSPLWEKINSIERCVNSGSNLTKQLLGFARGGKYDVQPHIPNHLMDKTYRLFKNTRKDITIHKEYSSSIWAVEVDQGQIEHVLLNLYVNAAQAMPEGGDLYLATQNVTLDDAQVAPFGVATGDYVKISVADTGIGMGETSKRRIFEPFFTTKEDGKGTGLGLASAFGIVKNHSGFIDIESKKGKGSCFHIYLPASKRVVADEGADVDAGYHLRGTESILLIDDEDYIIEAVKIMLEDFGHTVLVASGGEKALEIYAANKDKIELVILDMVMPDMGGGDVFDRLKALNPDVKVLLSSGYSINGQATAIMERGCEGFIQKPYDGAEISQKIREILNKK